MSKVALHSFLARTAPCPMVAAGVSSVLDLPAFYDYASGTVALLIAVVSLARLVIKFLSEWRDYRDGR